MTEYLGVITLGIYFASLRKKGSLSLQKISKNSLTMRQPNLTSKRQQVASKRYC